MEPLPNYETGSQAKNHTNGSGLSIGFGIAPPDNIKYHFSGHETFPFRYAWLPKGILNLQKDQRLFSSKDAIVTLGVGKNMVRSIQHWCDTLGLIESVPGERGAYQVTEIGGKLFGEDGWDIYMENPGTLWLLHWQLASRWDRASTWFLAFTRWNTDEFTRDQLCSWLLRVKENESPSSRGTKASIKRDVDTFIRTYVPSKVTRTRPLEDTFDCPLVELGLISEAGRDTFDFVRGPKPSLPDEIFTYALVDFWRNRALASKTLTFETLMHAQGSPGRAFKLSENALVERLERLPEWTHMTFGDTAGQRQVYLQADTVINPLDILAKYYATTEPAK